MGQTMTVLAILTISTIAVGQLPPQVTIDCEFDDWVYEQGGSSDDPSDIQPGDLVEPTTINIGDIGMCTDRFWNRLLAGRFGFGFGSAFSDTAWTCYEMYLDSDTVGKDIMNGDSTTPWYDIGAWKFLPDYRFRFCGRNGEVEEERFQYWDGNQWVGNAVADDPRLSWAVCDTIYFEWGFTVLDSIGITTPYPAWRTRYPVMYAGKAWQGQYYDISKSTGTIYIGDYDPINSTPTTWQEMKQQMR
jgi:hypothetical protein